MDTGEIDESELTGAGERGATVDGMTGGVRRTIEAATLRRCCRELRDRIALDLTNADIRAHLRLNRHAAVQGTIRLEGATIHGMLALNGQLSQPEHRSLVGGSAMTVDGDVYLDGLRADGGRINLRGATMDSLVADGARLHNPGDYSISLKEATVKGSVQLTDGFVSTGLVVLSRSSIEGRLQFTGGSFTCAASTDHNLSGDAIEAISATARGGLVPAGGRRDLRHHRLRIPADARLVGPGDPAPTGGGLAGTRILACTTASSCCGG